MSLLVNRVLRTCALAACLTVGAAAAAQATPGVPADPAPLFTENFENLPGGTTIPVLITNYTGATGVTYAASPDWSTNIQNCNGIITSANSVGYPSCENYQPLLADLSHLIGLLPGNGGDADHVLAHATAVDGEGVVMFESSQIPMSVSNRFLTLGFDAASQNCGLGYQPLYDFFVAGPSSGWQSVSRTPIDTCTDPRGIPAGSGYYGSYTTDGSALYNGTSVGLVAIDEFSALADGNDGALDNVTILDATPTLDKAFSPTRINDQNQPVNNTTTLTFTVTNTSELAEKAGWSFTDNLPSGLTAVGGSSTTCPAAAVSAPSGAGAITITGTIGAAQASCTVSVPVQAQTHGSYTNSSDNVSETGINPPATPSSVSVNIPPTAAITTPPDNADYFVGQNVAASYSCADADGTVASCVGNVPNGSNINTSSAGVKAFTVTATDNEGAVATKTVHYNVHPVIGTCRGTALRALGTAYGSANEQADPCVNASSVGAPINTITGPGTGLGSLLNSLGGSGIQGAGLTGQTFRILPATHSAAGDVATLVIKVGTLTIGVSLIHADARATLTSCSSANLGGNSHIAKLTINGAVIPIAENIPVALPLGIGTLYLNQRVVGDKAITTRALFLDLAGTSLDVIAGEATASVACGPLPPA